MKDAFAAALVELGTVGAALDAAELERLAASIAAAGRVALYGCGREGLMMRALAMRLHHLGLAVGYQGEMTCPPVGRGDLFLCSAGPGELATVTALIRVARGAGAEVALLTAEPGAKAAALADLVVTIPARTMARDRAAPTSTLPMGSLYEGALFLMFEALVLDLQARLGVSPEAMRARHTNLE
ncbi:MAG: SIS domain-containing protein [Paracoccaceae bacterium]|nr:SIS domain-containing protein [Paracoccaceae bacterium]